MICDVCFWWVGYGRMVGRSEVMWGGRVVCGSEVAVSCRTCTRIAHWFPTKPLARIKKWIPAKPAKKKPKQRIEGKPKPSESDIQETASPLKNRKKRIKRAKLRKPTTNRLGWPKLNPIHPKRPALPRPTNRATRKTHEPHQNRKKRIATQRNSGNQVPTC